jgi:hypothetical protein
MKFATAAALASVAIAKPRVQGPNYSHQWDLVNVDGFNVLFSSSYDIALTTDTSKTNVTWNVDPKNAGTVKFDSYFSGYAIWEIQLGMNVGDYAWFILKSKLTAADIRPLNLSL